MPVRITWSDNEIALLVEMTINTIKNPQSYKNNVESLSATLRKMAINNGIEIDEKYRNCNGIILQMTKMRYLLTNGREGMPGASNDFKRIADMYINNRTAFVSLCEESKKMIDSDKSFSTAKSSSSEFTQTGFYKWMIANGKSEYMAKNYASVINSCEAFACKSGYPDNKIYENADAAKIISKLLDDIQFEIFSLRKQRKPKYALLLYLDYISDKPIENNEKQSIPYENNEFFGWLLNHKGFNEKRANEYVNALIEAETMARRNKFTSKKPISSDDIAEVIRTKRKLELFDEYIRKNEESEFVFSYAINEYISFLKYSESEVAGEHDVESVPEKQRECGDNPSQDALCVLDMNNSISLSYTSPKVLLYNGVEWVVRNWSELYVTIMKLIVKEYPNKFYSGMNLGGATRVDIADDKLVSIMKAPKRLFEGVYIETSYSATDLVNRIGVHLISVLFRWIVY